MKKELENIDVLTLIPQRPPFVMVDRLIAFDSVSAVTEFEVREDNLFVDDGKLSFGGVVENVAQSCAARLGYINHQLDEPVKLGVIGAVKNFEVSRLPLVGETLTTRILVRETVFAMMLVSATVCVGDTEIAHADMKIAVTDTDASTKA